jgi:hypothetical protein
MAKKPKTNVSVEQGGYPYNTLSQALKVGAAVKDHGGRDVPKSLIAESLSMSHNSSGFWSVVASAKAYGIVDGSRDMSLTEAGRQYFYAASELAQRRALLIFFGSPPKFKALLNSYDGSGVPSQAMLTGALRKMGLAETWGARAASFFTSAAQQVGAIDEAGFLRYKAAVAKAERSAEDSGDEIPAAEYNGGSDNSQEVRPVQSTTIKAEPSPVSAPGKTVWQFGGGAVRIETPDPITRAMWERLKKYVELLEPDDSNKEVAQGGSNH